MRLDESMIETLDNYLHKRLRPGSFTFAILAGDLYHAVQLADQVNRHRIYDIAKFIRDNFPKGSYGSYKEVEAWLS